MAYEDDEQYGGESSEEKANVERTRIGMRKRGLPESREVETSRQIAMENQAIKSLMQRYRIRDKAEAEELFDRMGGLKEYRKMFNMVEADDYQSNRDRIAALDRLPFPHRLVRRLVVSEHPMGAPCRRRLVDSRQPLLVLGDHAGILLPARHVRPLVRIGLHIV